jgi:hypothetical protein
MRLYKIKSLIICVLNTSYRKNMHYSNAFNYFRKQFFAYEVLI